MTRISCTGRSILHVYFLSAASHLMVTLRYYARGERKKGLGFCISEKHFENQKWKWSLKTQCVLLTCCLSFSPLTIRTINFFPHIPILASIQQWRKGEGIAEPDLKPWKLEIWTLRSFSGADVVAESKSEGKHERVEGEMKGISKEAENVCMDLKKNIIIFDSPNYIIVITVHSKTILQNRLRMCAMKKIQFFLITKLSPRNILRRFQKSRRNMS